MRNRVGALITKNKRLLLVTNNQSEYYWSPGGGIEDGETDEQTLRRELHEELNVEIIELKKYLEINHSPDPVFSKFYLVEISGKPIPANEISGMCWYSKMNFENKLPQVSPWLSGRVIPRLIEDGFL